MYLPTVKKLNDYLNSLVVEKSYVAWPQVINETDKTRLKNPINGQPVIEHNRILFEKGREKDFFLYDQGAIFDPIEKRVTGDHYATSHFVLMSSVLYKLTGEKKYLDRAIISSGFCLKILQGYPRVPWGMHYDFNNYAMALSCFFLKDALNEKQKKIWLKNLKTAKRNRHRVANWQGQRALYSLFYNLSSEKSSVLHKLNYLINLLFFMRNWSDDGSLDDKKDRSRPIQYHAFSLAISIIIYSLTGNRLIKKRILSGVEYLIQFIAPDGDFNYFGRGHRQIFAYSPALFVLEYMRKQNTELQRKIDSIWNHIIPYQKKDGSFPLVLNNFPDENKIGWYDYHRFTVYNSFFGAWLALAEYERKIGFSKYSGQFSNRKVPKSGTSKIITISKKDYFICLTSGFSSYSSECAVSPHKLFFKNMGTIFSCPGGPTKSIKGFGNINKFEHEDVNFFSPIYQDQSGDWINPGKIKSDFKSDNDTVAFDISFGVFRLERIFKFSDRVVYINDQLSIAGWDSINSIRLANIPINISEKLLTIEKDIIYLKSIGSEKVMSIEITGLPNGLKKSESFDWVDGRINVISATTDKKLSQFNISYQIKQTI